MDTGVNIVGGKRFGINSSPHSAHTKCLSLIAPNTKVLDIGCATGYLGAELKKRGCSVTGLEQRQERAEIAKKYCDEVIAGDAETIKLNREKQFDVIMFIDVLGYFKEPQEVLARYMDYLKDDGYMVLSVPNIANWSIRLSLLFGNFDYKSTGILDREYIRFFTEKTLRETIEQAGMRIEKIDTTTNIRGARRIPLVGFLTGLRRRLFGYQFIIKAVKADKK